MSSEEVQKSGSSGSAGSGERRASGGSGGSGGRGSGGSAGRGSAGSGGSGSNRTPSTCSNEFGEYGPCSSEKFSYGPGGRDCMPDNPFLPDSWFESPDEKVTAHIVLFCVICCGIRLTGLYFNNQCPSTCPRKSPIVKKKTC